MNLNTIEDVRGGTAVNGDLEWREGDSWLAGGTWLFSEPQPHLRRLLDLRAFDWPPLEVRDDGLRIAATCTIADLYALPGRPDWPASFLIDDCCRSFLSSFKIWKTATVGGNICMSLPAGPMISLTSAFDGVCTIWQAGGGEWKIPVVDFVTGDQRNVLAPGDLLRQVEIPLAALRRRSAFRQISLTPVGRSAALLIGSVTSDGRLALTITASTKRPVRLSFAEIPNSKELRETILQRIADDLYHSDVHGKPIWRKHMTLRLAEEIRVELQGTAYA
jgi:CO/xanthine dehydrogenase FAD-binding subunit